MGQQGKIDMSLFMMKRDIAEKIENCRVISVDTDGNDVAGQVCL